MAVVVGLGALDLHHVVVVARVRAGVPLGRAGLGRGFGSVGLGLLPACVGLGLAASVVLEPRWRSSPEQPEVDAAVRVSSSDIVTIEPSARRGTVKGGRA